jgi:phosphate-selective porin OprO and OprP
MHVMDRSWGAGVLIALLLASPGARAAAADTPEKEEVFERVEALEHELALLRRKLEVQDEAAATRAPQAVVGAGTDGFYLRSPDQKYQLRLRGYTQFDGRFFNESASGRTPETFAFRRIRPILEGTLAGVVDFRLMPDFAGSTLVVQDAYANLRYLPEAQLQFGKFKGPVSLERLQSATAMYFIERGFPTLFAPNRDTGVMLQGVFGENVANYQLAWTNGVNDNGLGDVDTNDQKDLTGRFFVHPFQRTRLEPLQGLGVGFAASYGRQAGAPPTYRTAGQQTLLSFATGVVQTGTRRRYYPQAYWSWGPFGLLAEYAYSSGKLVNAAGTLDARTDDRAWQVELGYVLTGENASYRGVVPSSSFDPFAGTFGALELVARWGQVDFDDAGQQSGLVTATSPEGADDWAIGVNWYLNRFTKLALNYERTTFDGFGDAPDRDPEGLVVGRFQLSY